MSTPQRDEPGQWGSAQQGTLKAEELAVLLRTSARYLDVSDPHMAVTQR